VNIGLFFVLFCSLLLKVKTSFASTGRFSDGYSEDALGYFLIVIALAIIVAWTLSLLHDVREFNTRQSFRCRVDGGMLALPKLKMEDDGEEGEKHHAFVSHSQQDAGDQVAGLKKELEKFVSTMVIFTDVASGRTERALTEKSALYRAIKQSACVLVFLTKTYFTRKWCIKELQEAIARGKHIVFIIDNDTRHGGMGIREMVEYALGQRERAAADARIHASNLHNQATLDGDAECEELLAWVVSHIKVGGENGDRLIVLAFEYEMDRHTHEVLDIEQHDFPVVPWYRYAEWKVVALQMIVQHMLAVPSWGISEQKRELTLPVPRKKLPALQSGYFHVALSARHTASACLEQKLRTLAPNIRVYRPADGQAFTPEGLAKCSCFLLANNPDTEEKGTMSQLVNDAGYQEDVRMAIDTAGLRLLLLHECTTEIVATQAVLWAMVEQGAGAFKARHVSAIFNPIAIYCQPTLLRAESSNTPFDDSTLVQLERAITAAQPHSARRWFACAGTAMGAKARIARGVKLNAHAFAARHDVAMGSAVVENPMTSRPAAGMATGEPRKVRGWSTFADQRAGEDQQFENPLAHLFGTGSKGMSGAAKAHLKDIYEHTPGPAPVPAPSASPGARLLRKGKQLAAASTTRLAAAGTHLKGMAGMARDAMVHREQLQPQPSPRQPPQSQPQPSEDEASGGAVQRDRRAAPELEGGAQSTRGATPADGDGETDSADGGGEQLRTRALSLLGTSTDLTSSGASVKL
jgi:hypothetical protein